MRKVFRVEDSLSWCSFHGRTDGWIARQVLEKYGHPVTQERVQGFLNAYLEALRIEMNNPRARILPGVSEILRSIADRAASQNGQPAIVQGLLTGNLVEGARIKLEALGLWDYFPFGAFADDSEWRNDLGPHAVRRASDFHQRSFTPERVWIIGDTPYDIECGKAIGASTIAVATGKCPEEELRNHAPTALFTDLTNSAAFFSTISG